MLTGKPKSKDMAIPCLFAPLKERGLEIIQEVWITIKNFPNYQVSNFGRVKNKTQILKIQYNKNSGRPYVNLYSNGFRKAIYIYRLVALAFIPNPKKLTEINHIDRNIKNNLATNLEWVSPKENMKHLEDNFNFSFGRLPIIGVNKITKEKVKFSSIKEAVIFLKATGYPNASAGAISGVINGKRKSAYNYLWSKQV